MKRFLVIGALAVGCAAGCGGSNTASNTGSTEGQSGHSASTPEQAAAQALEELSKHPAVQTKSVEYTELKKLIPDVAGWEKSDVKGEQGAAMGMSFSRAEGRYQKGDLSVKLEITDTAMIQALVMPFTMMAAGGFNQKSDEGYKQGVTISGNPGWEEWENEGKNGELNVLVAKRFIVRAEGHDLPNMDPVKQIVQAVNASTLAALK